MKRTLTAAVATASLCLCVHASAAPADGEAQFRELYKELVETNTSLAVSGCGTRVHAQAQGCRGNRGGERSLHRSLLWVAD